MREADFQAQVVELATLCGWKIHHDRGDYRECIAGDPGFPDLVLARNGKVIIAELKTETGELSSIQREWLTELGAFSAYELSLRLQVWRPVDLEIIAKLLSPRRR